MRCLVVPLILVGLCTSRLLPVDRGCGEPDIPLHSTYVCQAPLCQGPLENGTFEADAMLQYICQPGYVLASLPGIAVCHRGVWHMLQGVLCEPQGTSVAPHGGSLSLVNFIPLMAGTLVLLSALILALTLCFLVVRSAPSPCGCTSQAYETLEDPDFTVEGVDGPRTDDTEDNPVSLPSYEEAVSGDRGPPVPPASQVMIPLVVSPRPEQPGSSRVPGGSLEMDDPPPSYEDVMAAASAVAENSVDRQLADRRPQRK